MAAATYWWMTLDLVAASHFHNPTARLLQVTPVRVLKCALRATDPYGDAWTRLNGRLLVLQFKASNRILRSGSRRFKLHHGQLDNPRQLVRAQRSVFYVFPLVGDALSNQRPLPCEVCKVDSSTSCTIGTFRILMPSSPFTGRIFSYRLLVFSAQVAASFPFSDNSRLGPPERRRALFAGIVPQVICINEFSRGEMILSSGAVRTRQTGERFL